VVVLLLVAIFALLLLGRETFGFILGALLCVAVLGALALLLVGTWSVLSDIPRDSTLARYGLGLLVAPFIVSDVIRNFTRR
jgi:hypothetical protein